MDEQIIIRFRDLTVELGGTIADHRAILAQFGEVWWGWFMQPYETTPRELFASLLHRIERDGTVPAILFDTGQGMFYRAQISDIKVAPTLRGLPTPDPERSPEYYHRGRYSAWFKLTGLIGDSNLDDLSLQYRDFPTKSKIEPNLDTMRGKSIASVEELQRTKCTLWVVSPLRPRA